MSLAQYVDIVRVHIAYVAAFLGTRPPSVGGRLRAWGWCVRRFRYAPSIRPKKTIADATPVKTHTGSKPLPNGRSKSNPSVSAAKETTPLKITGQFIGTSPVSILPPYRALETTSRAASNLAVLSTHRATLTGLLSPLAHSTTIARRALPTR